MKKILCKELDYLLSTAEKLDWNCEIYVESEKTYNGQHSNDKCYIELEQYSPAGEDFSMSIDFDKENIVDSFLENLKSYSDGFDVNEHVEMWLPSRGKGGCPSEICELLEDAEAIKDMIETLYETLCEIQKDGK